MCGGLTHVYPIMILYCSCVTYRSEWICHLKCDNCACTLARDKQEKIVIKPILQLRTFSSPRHPQR